MNGALAEPEEGVRRSCTKEGARLLLQRDRRSLELAQGKNTAQVTAKTRKSAISSS